ncbi:hypothetical protein KDL44_02895 [bacterium]|nr:hypothetical protein [bacterium]
MSAAGTGIVVVCTFRVKEGADAQFEELLARHWPTLNELGLVTARPTQLFKGDEKGGGRVFIEVFEWLSEDASRRAHELQEVMAIWEPMGALVEMRGTKPPMDFIHVNDLAL